MATYFISRHPGAAEWAARQGIDASVIEHLDPASLSLSSADTVIGILPVHLAAAVCEQGAEYINLSIDIPPEARGKELSADEMEAYNARLEGFVVRKPKNNAEPSETAMWLARESVNFQTMPWPMADRAIKEFAALIDKHT